MKKSQKIAKNSKESRSFLNACDNTAISVDCLSVNIRHLRPYFLCRLEQNNLKSETNVEYTKLRKTKNNNRKSKS